MLGGIGRGDESALVGRFSEVLVVSGGWGGQGRAASRRWPPTTRSAQGHRRASRSTWRRPVVMTRPATAKSRSRIRLGSRSRAGWSPQARSWVQARRTGSGVTRPAPGPRARAARIAEIALAGCSARASMRRQTVGSEATDRTAHSRRGPRRYRPRTPPSAIPTARSSTVSPGSWTDRAARQPNGEGLHEPADAGRREHHVKDRG